MGKSRIPPSSMMGGTSARIQDAESRITNLDTFDGSQYGRLYEKMLALYNNITAQVAAAISSLSMTVAQIKTYVSAPETGVAANGNVSATGNITANGNLSGDGNGSVGGAFTAGTDISCSGVATALGSRSLVLSSGYAGMWIDSAGRMGISPSSIRFKTDLEQWLPNISRLLLLRAVLFRYDPHMLGDMDPAAPKQLGFIAEELEALGFEEFLFYEQLESGEHVPQGINYDRLTVALLVLAQHQQSQIDSLANRLDAAGL